MIGLVTRGKFGIVDSYTIGLATTGIFNPIETVAEVIYTTISQPTIDKIVYRDREKPIPRVTVMYKEKKDEEISIGVNLI